ncbi:unnamed protein product, partial [marine sediment metagenome]
ESFLNPPQDLIELFGGDSILKPPPEVTLILGLRFYQCVLNVAPIQEILFNWLYIPQRMVVPIELWVIEEGTIEDINVGVRAVLALVQSTIGVITPFVDVF